MLSRDGVFKDFFCSLNVMTAVLVEREMLTESVNLGWYRR